MRHAVVGCEGDEVGGAAVEHWRQVPDFEALPGADEQHAIADPAALAHQRGQHDRAIVGDLRLFDEAIGAAQPLRFLLEALRFADRLALQIAAIEAD